MEREVDQREIVTAVKDLSTLVDGYIKRSDAVNALSCVDMGNLQTKTAEAIVELGDMRQGKFQLHGFISIH